LTVFCLIGGFLGWSVGRFCRSVVRLVGRSVGRLVGSKWRFSALFNVAAPSATVTSAPSQIIQKLFTGMKDKNVKCYV